MIENPFNDPIFLPSLLLFGVLLVLGFGIVLFFARHDLRAGLSGELGKRYISWMIIAPLFLVTVFVGGLIGAVILLLFIYRIVLEYIHVVGVKHSYALYLYAMIPITFGIGAFLPAYYFMLPAAAILLLTLLSIFSHRIEDLYVQVSYAGRGYFYLVWSVCHLILLKELGGIGLVMVAGVGVALSDVMQYTVGKLIGKHLIAPEVSPHKAWEGLIGDLLGAGMAVALFRFALPPEFTPPLMIILAILIALGAAWGDLASSLVKRVAGTKDWGEILPGHGGLLDRANSMVVVIPLVYYFSFFVLVTMND